MTWITRHLEPLSLVTHGTLTLPAITSDTTTTAKDFSHPETCLQAVTYVRLLHRLPQTQTIIRRMKR